MPNETVAQSSILGFGSENDCQSSFTLRVHEMLGKKDVVDKLRSALFPSKLADEMRSLKTEITPVFLMEDILGISY